MKIARYSFVPPIKDVTAASQRVNSKWGLALPSTVRSHNDLYFPCFLPPLSTLPPPSTPCHPPPLSSVSLYSLRQAPCDGCVLTGLSHSDATRGMPMCPRLCRGITPCGGTSASALSRIHGSARCGKKAQWLGKEFFFVCVITLGLSLRPLVCRCSHFWSQLSL